MLADSSEKVDCISEQLAGSRYVEVPAESRSRGFHREVIGEDW